MRRRTFLQRAIALGAGATLAGLPSRVVHAQRAPSNLVAAAATFDDASFRDLCLRTARDNVVSGLPVPSRAYEVGTWLRDAFWTVAGLDDRALLQRTWSYFASHQDPTTGQVPTAILHPFETTQFKSDESTALFAIQALTLRRAGGQVDTAPLERATRYLLARVNPVDGRVWAGPGPWTWWLDSLVLPTRDTVAYSQGVTAVALRALLEMGQPVPRDLLARVEDAYAGLYREDLGALPMSARLDLLDVSCLVGEHLSLRHFNRPLLDSLIVYNTLQACHAVTFPDGAFLGYRVASPIKDAWLPDDWFIPAPDNWPGHYHNGGSWLLYDALALWVARSHQVPGTDDLLRARLAAETRHAEALHEYLATDPSQPDFGSVPYSWRADYAWNSYAATLL